MEILTILSYTHICLAKDRPLSTSQISDAQDQYCDRLLHSAAQKQKLTSTFKKLNERIKVDKITKRMLDVKGSSLHKIRHDITENTFMTSYVIGRENLIYFPDENSRWLSVFKSKKKESTVDNFFKPVLTNSEPSMVWKTKDGYLFVSHNKSDNPKEIAIFGFPYH